MRKTIIFALALAAWGFIVRLSYQMAQARIKLCYGADDCDIRAAAARDYVLTVGLTVALVASIIAALLWTRTLPSLPSQWRRPSKPAEPTRLR